MTVLILDFLSKCFMKKSNVSKFISNVLACNVAQF